MNGALWAVASVFLHTFVGPFAGAAEPLSLPLPQDVDYATEMRGELLAANFSTDPRAPRPQVAAEASGSGLEAFIINYETCVLLRDVVAYRLVVRNVKETVASGVIGQFHYPPDILEYKEGTGFPPTTVTPGNAPGLLNWQVGTVLPGHENWHELNLTFTVKAPAGGISTELTVGAGDGSSLAGTSHTIPYNCPGAPEISTTPAATKQPAIICDPGDLDCGESIPQLGPLFKEVVQNARRRPTLCSELDVDGCVENMPNLGPRFAEATASLLPGECSVLEDAILSDPAFHDGLNRRADVAAFFMRPLYNSGQDFSRLVLENELLGLDHLTQARSILSGIHTKHWELRRDPLNKVVQGALTTNTIRSQINQWHLDWITETRQAQVDLYSKYEELQKVRNAKFDPVAEAAITNAEDAIKAACGAAPPPPQEKDGRLRRLLYISPNNVEQTYDQSLRDQLDKYRTMQELFVNPNDALFPERARATTWQRDLRAALDAFDAGKPELLKQFIVDIALKDESGFAAGWQLTYLAHAAGDVAADENVRLSSWEKALDSPKEKAAGCARDTTLAARVEVSWCESGTYPGDYILSEALYYPAVRDALPPEEIGGGETSRIDVQRVVGESCGGLPGDPFWAEDCSCNCNQLVTPARDGNILFCQASRPLQSPPPTPETPVQQPGACQPLVCPGGTSFPTCGPNGVPINYFINPCTVIPAPAPPVSTIATGDSFAPIAPAPPTTPELPPPAVDCQPLQCPNGSTFPRCDASGIPISYLLNPCLLGQPGAPSEEPEPPGTGSGIKPIIRHDMYSIAQAPRTQDECLQERALDDHFLVNYPQ